MASNQKGFLYDGTFPLNFLKRTEIVRAGNVNISGEGSCEICDIEFKWRLPVSVGDVVTRDADGEIVIVSLEAK
jgi:hypothetical protein